MQADIGDRAPERIELMLDCLDHLVDGAAVAQIPCPGPDLVLTIFGGEAGALGFQRLLPARRHGDLRAFGQQGLDDPKADAAARAGDKDHLICQAEIHDAYAVGSL